MKNSTKELIERIYSTDSIRSLITWLKKNEDRLLKSELELVKEASANVNCIIKNESTTSNDTDTASDIDKVSSFNVTTYSFLDKDEKFCHWSKGLNMVIEKEGVTIKLNSEEIQEIVKSLPKTVGGRY